MTTKRQTLSTKVLHDGLSEKINFISQYKKAFIKKGLLRLANESRENAKIVCNYIISEQTEINIKESTKEGKIKCLLWLSSLLSHKSYRSMTKQDILDYLNSLRKPESEDSTHRWIGLRRLIMQYMEVKLFNLFGLQIATEYRKIKNI